MLRKIAILSSSRGKIILLLLTVALISAISVSFLTDLCGGCASSAKMAPIPGLNIIGAIYYGLTVASLLRFGLRKWTIAPLFFAVGVHSVLVHLLFRNEVFCANCFTCAACVLLAALTAMKGQSLRFAGVSAIAGLATCFVTFTTAQKVFLTLERSDAEKLIGFANWPRQSRGPLRVTIFAKDSCPKCQEFKRTDLPHLRKVFGEKLEIDIRTPPGKIRLPSIVLAGEKPTLLIGKPKWNELSAAIKGHLEDLADTHRLSASGTAL